MHTTLHNFTQVLQTCRTLQHSARLHKHFTTLLHNYAQLYNTLQNLQQLLQHLQHFTQFFRTSQTLHTVDKHTLQKRKRYTSF